MGFGCWLVVHKILIRCNFWDPRAKFNHYYQFTINPVQARPHFIELIVVIHEQELILWNLECQVIIARNYNDLQKEHNILPLLYGLVTPWQGGEELHQTVIVTIPGNFFFQSTDAVTGFVCCPLWLGSPKWGWSMMIGNEVWLSPNQHQTNIQSRPALVLDGPVVITHRNWSVDSVAVGSTSCITGRIHPSSYGHRWSEGE